MSLNESIVNDVAFLFKSKPVQALPMVSNAFIFNRLFI